MWFSWYVWYVKCWKLDETGMLVVLEIGSACKWVELSLYPVYGLLVAGRAVKSVDQEIWMFFSEVPAHFLQFFFDFRVEKNKIFRDPATESRNLLSRSQWRSRARCDPKSFTRTHRVVCQDVKRQVRVVDLYNEVMSSDFFLGEIAYVFIHKSNWPRSLGVSALHLWSFWL